MSNSELTTVPESIGNLSVLSNLNLSDNQIISIPESLCNIPSSCEINVSNNELCPPFFFECIDNLGYQICFEDENCITNYSISGYCLHKDDINFLTDIIVSNENITTYIPIFLGDQIWIEGKLDYLSLSGHQISYIPESIEYLSNISELDLSYNQIVLLPESICNLPETCILKVNNNIICPPFPSCIPENDLGYQNCNLFPDCMDKFTGIDEYCYFLPDLNILQEFIDSNQTLNGQTQLQIGYQDWASGRLYVLELMNKQLTFLPENIGSLNYLTELSLYYNHNLSYLPESVGNLTKLIKLDLRNNQFTSLPDNIGNLSSLKYFYLQNNHLSSLPETICDIPSECQIRVQNNNLCEDYHYYCIDDWGDQNCDNE